MSLRIVGVCGSLRKESYNRKLLKLILVKLATLGAGAEEVSIGDIPLYNGDIEEKGIPKAVQTFKEELKSADGLVFVTPEYNWSIPGVFKNAIDWASRPSSDIPKIFHGQVVLQAGSSDGARATVRAQQHLLSVYQTLKLIVLPQQILIANENEAFDNQGNLARESDLKQLEKVAEKFIEMIRKLK